MLYFFAPPRALRRWRTPASPARGAPRTLAVRRHAAERLSVRLLSPAAPPLPRQRWRTGGLRWTATQRSGCVCACSERGAPRRLRIPTCVQIWSRANGGARPLSAAARVAQRSRLCSQHAHALTFLHCSWSPGLGPSALNRAPCQGLLVPACRTGCRRGVPRCAVPAGAD